MGLFLNTNFYDHICFYIWLTVMIILLYNLAAISETDLLSENKKKRFTIKNSTFSAFK